MNPLTGASNQCLLPGKNQYTGTNGLKGRYENCSSRWKTYFIFQLSLA